MSARPLYRIRMMHQDKVIEIYAKSVGPAGMLGFVEIGGLSFGGSGRLVVSPEEEALEREFEGVRRFFVPMHAIVRIDEVEQAGAARVVPGDVARPAALVPFPAQGRKE